MSYEELLLKVEIYTLCVALTAWRGTLRHSMEVRAKEVVPIHQKTGITVTTTVPKGLSTTRNSETGLTNGETKHYPFWDYR